MFQSLWEYCVRTWHGWGKLLSDQWYHITPEKYAIGLILVGLFGWLLMKSGTKRAGQ